MFTDPPILCCTKFLSLWMHCLCVCVYVSMSIWYVCVCVCIDLRLGWEPCSVPAWMINGVVMAIGRNEGTKRRRPASLDPCAPPGAHNLTHTHKFTLHALHLSDRHVSHSNNPVKLPLLHHGLPYFSFALYLSIIFCPLSSSLNFLPDGVHSLFFFSFHPSIQIFFFNFTHENELFVFPVSGKLIDFLTTYVSFALNKF